MRCGRRTTLSIVMVLLFALSASLVWGAPALLQEVPSHFDAFQTEEDWLNNAKDLADIRDLAIKHVFGPDTDPASAAPPSDLQRVWITNGHPSIPVAMTRFLFEGDILLSRPQMDSIKQNLLRKLNRYKRNAGFATRFRRFVENTIINEVTRVKRKLYSNEYARWKEFPIRYVISDTFDDKTRRRIRDQIAFYEDNTCLTFQEYTGLNSGDYLEFFRGSGCYSMIGYVGGRQGISIGSGCERSGVIQHEIGHALGFWHEQSRPDADSYIRINSDSIIRSMISNFLKRTWAEVTTFNVPYDVGSVMHYGPTAFTKDWNKFTIETLDPDQQRTIGQRERLSFHDLHLLNQAYCSDTCSYSIDCQHGGYQHPVRCNECLCPNGLAGDRCDRVEDPINAECGGELTAMDEYQEITSPGYPYGYEVDQKCVWLIRAPQGRKVHFEFVDRFQFFCTTTCLDYVEVKTHSDLRDTGARFCCFTAPDHAFESQADYMLIIFRSTLSRDVGFKGRYRISPYYWESHNITTTTTGQSQPGGEPAEVRTTTESTTSTSTTTTSTTTSSTPTQEQPEHTAGKVTDAREVAPTDSMPQMGKEATTERRITSVSTPEPGVEGTGDWTDWGSWTPCSKTCGGCGITTRIRNCENPPCEGNSQEFRSCGFDLCPADTVCSKLNFYDKPCGPFGVQVCSKGDSTDYERCNTDACADCADENLFFPEFFARCREQQDQQSCAAHRRKLIDAAYTCPCCKPLVERGGQCVMPASFMH